MQRLLARFAGPKERHQAAIQRETAAAAVLSATTDSMVRKTLAELFGSAGFVRRWLAWPPPLSLSLEFGDGVE
jgi:hypothetical protein